MAVTYSYGAAPTYVKIASRTLSATSATVTFSNLPQGYTDLMLVMNTGTGAYTDNYITFNGDTGSNYSYTRIVGSPSGATSTRASNQSNLYFASSDTTIVSGTTVHFMNYSNSSIYKTLLIRNGLYGSTTNISQVFSGLWRSTAPITSFTLSLSSSTWSTGSTFTIYGIKAALTPKATGGNLVYNDSSYWYHVFTSTGQFTPISTISADYLVVAGGGGGGAGDGGSAGGGGGGAGGFRTSTGLSLTAQTYTVTVGAGGAGAVGGTSTNNGTSGGNSTLSTITSTGGGGGGLYSANGLSGGSGGGGGPAGGSGTAGQGTAGGTRYTNSTGGGGGGGATSAGSNGPSDGVGGAGGAGTASSYSGNSVTYAGGGGGGGVGTAGVGGSGGGGRGGQHYDGDGQSGLQTLGAGGGGGSMSTGTPGSGGNGGSGIVIVRYAV